MEKRGDKGLRIVCSALEKSLVKGSSLTEAMGEQMEFFSQLAIALTVVGEESGHLSEILTELADYYSRQEELKNVIVKASIYPLFLLSFSVLILCFFIGYVMPVLGNAYVSLQVQPRGMLALLLALNSPDMVSMELLLISLLLLAVVSFFKRRNLEEGILRLPLVSSVYRMLLELRFCKLLALMLSSGIDISRAVGLCSAALGNEKISCRLQLFNNRLQKGMDIGSAAVGCDMFFSPVTIELITVGASTGYLPEMLEEAARLCEHDLYNKLDKLKELFAPCLLLVASLVIGAVVCSVVEPLFGLIGQI